MDFFVLRPNVDFLRSDEIHLHLDQIYLKKIKYEGGKIACR